MKNKIKKVSYKNTLRTYYKQLQQTKSIPFSMEHTETLLALPHPQREQKIVEYFLQCGNIQHSKAA